MNRNIITGVGLAAALMLGVVAFTGGAQAETPKPAPPTGNQALPTTTGFLAEPAPKTEAAKPEAPKAKAPKAGAAKKAGEGAS